MKSVSRLSETVLGGGGSRPASEGIYLAPHFLDAGTCRHLRAAMDRGAPEPAEVLQLNISLDLNARRASSIEIDPAAINAVETSLDAARHAIAAFYNVPLATREGPGFLRYAAGDFYRRHRDRANDASWPGAARRLVSVVVFLNSSSPRPALGEFSGGELVIFPEPLDDVAAEAIEVVPRQGSLVAFHAATLHEVRPVAGGMRDVIVDWYYGPAEAGPYKP